MVAAPSMNGIIMPVKTTWISLPFSAWCTMARRRFRQGRNLYRAYHPAYRGETDRIEKPVQGRDDVATCIEPCRRHPSPLP
jgi:hypothetical protein